MKNESEKILGVIGGMGPLATQLFYRMVIEATEAEKDQDHLNMIILNHATMPDRTRAIMDDSVDIVLDKLTCDAKYLEEGGACCIAIPCNTTHAIINRLQERTNIPIINMVRSTAEFIRTQTGEGSKVGIMATSGTIKMHLYQDACLEHGLVPVVPSPENQQLVMKMIYDGVKKGEPVDFREFEKAAGELQDAGCEKVILGCTELSVIREMFSLTDYYVDAMKVLTFKSLTMCGKKIRY